MTRDTLVEIALFTGNTDRAGCQEIVDAILSAQAIAATTADQQERAMKAVFDLDIWGPVSMGPCSSPRRIHSRGTATRKIVDTVLAALLSAPLPPGYKRVEEFDEGDGDTAMFQRAIDSFKDESVPATDPVRAVPIRQRQKSSKNFSILDRHRRQMYVRFDSDGFPVELNIVSRHDGRSNFFGLDDEALQKIRAALAAEQKPVEITDEMVKRAARKIGPTVCAACRSTGFMEDGPAGATYSSPCTYCDADGIPTRALKVARTALSAALQFAPATEMVRSAHTEGGESQ